MFHHKVKKEKAKQGKGKRGNEREGERTPGKPLTRKCQSLRKEKTIESRDREEQKKKPGKLKESLFLILPFLPFYSSLFGASRCSLRSCLSARRGGKNKVKTIQNTQNTLRGPYGAQKARRPCQNLPKNPPKPSQDAPQTFSKSI